MANQNQAKSNDMCPVCSCLPLHMVAFGVDVPPMEYQLTDEMDAVIGNTKQFDECALYLIVRSLQKLWSEKEEFPARAYLSSMRRRWSCSGTNFEVNIDPFSWLANALGEGGHPPIHSDPLHPLVITRLRQWIQRCDSSHEGCRVDNIPLLPTRVLDTEGGPSSAFVKLVETSDGQRGPYIALSHCWGRSNPFITTRSNLEDMKSGFLIDRAPATFRDAVVLSRLLGIRYVWIDSMCIIQGDAKDWEIEASRMGKIYRDATLMLSAAYAAADSEGFLASRPHSHSTLKITSPSGQYVDVYLEPRTSTDFWAYVQQRVQPLDTRGWCLQEAYLPRRQLKFLHSRIMWYCQDAEWDESRREGNHCHKGGGTVITTNYLFRNSQRATNRTLNRMTPYQGWYRMIRDFTKRNLTFATDKLPALSGLASKIAEHDQGKYCVGAWWEDVAFGICWKKVSELSKIDEYIAPSWSWASVDGPIEFIDANENFFTQTELTRMAPTIFHSFHVQNRGSDKYGQVENAWIKLQAPMVALNSIDEETFQICGMDSPAEQIDLTFDFDGDNKRPLTALFLMRRLDNSQATQLIHNGRVKGVLGVLLFGLIIRAAPFPLTGCRALRIQDESHMYERVGFFKLLTSQSRESEWERNVNSIILV